MRSLLFTYLLLLAGAASLTAQENTEKFEDFLSKFTTNASFQYERIRFPLESSLLLSDADGEEKVVPFVRRMWPLLDGEALRTYRETMEDEGGIYVAHYVLNESEHKEFEAGFEDGSLDLRVVFKCIDGKWYVTDAFSGWYAPDTSAADLEGIIRQVQDENNVFIEQHATMKEITVKQLSATAVAAADVPALLDKAGISEHALNTVNWAEYPYCPDVTFRIAYTADAILLHYRVKEKAVRAKYTDGGKVWTDSCVEFFFSPDANNVYYNLESNCVGAIILGGGEAGTQRGHANESVLRTIGRWSSLGDQPFGERVGDTQWEVALVVPYSAFYLHDIHSLKGKHTRANFYKCGDDLPTPHFLSWNPIEMPRPNFHTPPYFGMLLFE
jgi:hypothetical protein